MLSQEQKERREHPRMPFNRLVLVKDDSGNAEPFIGINYSVRGMALNSKSPLPFGEFVELLFWITEPENKEMTMVAEVMQNFKQGDMYTTSVKFVNELSLN